MSDFLGGAFFGALLSISALVFTLAFYPEKRAPFYDFVESLGDDIEDE